MKNLFLSIAILFMAISAKASQSFYCTSFSEYINNQWKTVDSLVMISKTDGAKVWGSIPDYKVRTCNSKTDSYLKKNAKFIICNDTLYLGCHSLSCERMKFGNGFERGYKLNDSTFVFTDVRIGEKENSELSSMSFAFGLIGGLAKANQIVKKTACYILTGNNNKVTRINKEYMDSLLTDHPDLLEKYDAINKKEIESAETVIEYLTKLNLLH